MVSLLAAALLASPDFQAVEPKTEVRMGQINLAPPEALPLGGYTERGESLGESGRRPLRARFVAIQQGEKTLVMGGLEMLTVPESLIDSVRAGLPQGVDLVLAATHTHSAPDSQMLNQRLNFKIPGIATYSSRWLEWYSGQISAGIKSTLAAPPLLDGRVGVRRAQVDANRARRQGVAPDKWATQFSWQSNPLLGIYAAHPTLHEAAEKQMSGDWPGAWSDSGPWIALTGAIGAASPVAEGADGEAKSAFLASRLTTALGQVPAAWANDSSAKWTLAPINLPTPKPHPTFAVQNKISEPLAVMAVGRFAPTKASLFLLDWGGWLVIGVPGEPTEEVALRLRKTAFTNGFPRSVVVSHVNGWAGYMLEAADYDRGGYEAGLSFYGKNLGVWLSAALEAGCEELKKSSEERISMESRV